MYTCKVTGKVSKRGEPLNKIVVETRSRVYFVKVRNEETNKLEDVEVGRGSEIVREINASEDGLRQWALMSSEQRSRF